MKKNLILGAAICALALTGVATAQEAGFAPRDNGYQASHGAAPGFGPGFGSEGRRGKGPGRGGPALMMLGLADANGDNIVTREEVNAMQLEEFAFRDRNNDGYLDRNDASPIRQRADEARQERREARDAARQDAAREEGAREEGARDRTAGERRRGHRGMRGFGGRAMMGQMDSDNDRRISQEEFLAIQNPIFERLDANNDGAITGEEIEASIEERRSRRAEARSDRGWWRD